MGREIRKVPPNWEHPTYGEAFGNRDNIYYSRACGMQHCRGERDFISLYDQSHEDAAQEWIDNFIDWHVKGNIESEYSKYYWEYAGSPPEADYYRLYKNEEATWFQVYETVSEGSPVSPPFATEEELIQYLHKNGDFWAQSRSQQPPSLEAATQFVKKDGWAPSFIVNNGVITEGINICGEENGN